MIDSLKDAVRSSGCSLWGLSRATGGAVVAPELCRWLKGRGRLGQDKLDALAAVLGADLVIREPLIERKRAELRDAVAAVSPERNRELAAKLRAKG